MRLMVAPHDLEIGGSQINAIDLASGVAEAGHDVIVYGVPGPLVERILSLGLDYVPARTLRYRPAPSRVAQLMALARQHRLDLIHAYEWPPCLDAYFGAHLLQGVPLVCTVLSMSVSPLVPCSIPLVMGTEALGDEARRTHRAPVWVLEPPIDVDADHPGIDGVSFRQRLTLPKGRCLWSPCRASLSTSSSTPWSRPSTPWTSWLDDARCGSQSSAMGRLLLRSTPGPRRSTVDGIERSSPSLARHPIRAGRTRPRT